SRLTADFLHLSGIWRVHDPRGRERVIRTFCILYPLLAVSVYFGFREPQSLIKVGGIAQGLMLPMISGAALFLKQRDSDRQVGPAFLTDILTWLAFFAISGVAIYGVYDLVGKSFAR